MDTQLSPHDFDTFLGAPPPSFLQRHWRKLAVVGVLLILVLAGFLIFGRHAGGKAYATSPAERGDLQVLVTATGNLQPTNRVQVGAQTSGLINSVLVDVNDHVTRGQILAQIDPLVLKDTVTRSRAAVAQQEASVRQMIAALDKTKANLARLEEVRRLSGGQVPALTDLDNARADNNSAIANLAAARAQVVAARGQLASDLTNLSYATIRSPVTGVVLSRQIEPGQTVASSFSTPTLFEIAQDVTKMKLEVKVDEADVGQVATGQPASFKVDAWPGERFPARITRVNIGSNSSSSSSSSTSSSSSSSSSGSVVSYTAVLVVANPELKLRPGMTATAQIITAHEHGVLLVANGALRYKPTSHAAQSGFMAFGPAPGKPKEARINRGTRQTVYVLDGKGAPRPVNVIAGASNGSQTIVLSGDLHPGDRVITGELASVGG